VAQRRRRAKRAPAMFLAPFGLLFALFFLLPIGYAIYESLLKVHVSGLGLGPSSGRTWAGWPRSRAARYGPTPSCCSTGRTGGRSSWTRIPAAGCA
jgi:ABC-type sugar transport system permease subunit